MATSGAEGRYSVEGILSCFARLRLSGRQRCPCAPRTANGASMTPDKSSSDGWITAQSAHSPEKKFGKSFAGPLGIGLPCIIVARRPRKTLVNLAALVNLASVVQLLDISRFMWYNIGRGVTFARAGPALQTGGPEET